MRNAVVGGCVAVALLVGLVAGWTTTSSADAQRPLRDGGARALEDPQLVALSTEVDERRTQMILIDPQSRTMAVYHVDKSNGEISLRSVRNIHWDMQMDEFNGKNPLPREIRSLLQTR